MSKTLEQIEVGDRVWVRTGQYGRDLRRVERLTPKQIIVNGLIDYSRFHRGKLSRFGGEPSYGQVGGSHLSWTRIEAIATPEECVAWDAEQKAKADERETRKREEAARKAKREELNALFSSKPVYIHESHDRVGGWHVNITCSEDGVRRLAEALRGVIV